MNAPHQSDMAATQPVLANEFKALADQWYSETAHLSVVYKIVRHPAYQRIIQMGPAVLPLILEELQARPQHWFAALETITRENPVPAGANRIAARDAWLRWGRQRGYLA